jgi:hypothetical protein
MRLERVVFPELLGPIIRIFILRSMVYLNGLKDEGLSNIGNCEDGFLV